MKITSIQYDTLRQGYPKDKSHSADLRTYKESTSVGMGASKNIENSAEYSGNFTSKSEVAAISFQGNVNSNRIKSMLKTASKAIKKAKDSGVQTPKNDNNASRTKFGKFLESLEDHNIIGSALMALVFAGIARPATIMSMPVKEGKTKDDNIYASGHSIASGVIGFLASLVITAPLDEGIKMVKNHPRVFGIDTTEKLLDLKIELAKLGKSTADNARKIEIKDAIAALKKQRNILDMIVKNLPDWFIAIPRSMITIALIPPILKYGFGLEKSKSSKVQTPVVPAIASVPASTNPISKISLEEFRGGLKS